MEGTRNTKARILLIVSMAVFGTLAPFVRNIDLPSAELALYRAVMAAALVGVYLMLGKQRFEVSKFKREIPILLASGAAMGFNWILLFEAYKYTTVSIATLSYYFAPILVTLICPILFREKMTGRQILCFIMSTVGVVLIINVGSIEEGSSHFKGVLFGLGAAVLYAAVIICNKFIKNVAGLHRTFIQFIAAVIVLVPYVGFTEGVNLGNLNTRGWICLLIVGLIHTGVTYCMYFTSLKDLRGQEAAILSYIDPLVAVIISVTVLGEAITVLQVIGGCLILGFALLNEKN